MMRVPVIETWTEENVVFDLREVGRKRCEDK